MLANKRLTAVYGTECTQNDMTIAVTSFHEDEMKHCYEALILCLITQSVTFHNCYEHTSIDRAVLYQTTLSQDVIFKSMLK